MAKHARHLDEPEDIRMVFQRICLEGARVLVKCGQTEHEVPLVAEEPERFSLAITEVERGQWGISLGDRTLLRLRDRGRRYEAITELEAVAKLPHAEVCHFAMPRTLASLDEWSLADFEPDRPMPCTYTTPSLQIRDGAVRAFGSEGFLLVLRGADGPAPLRLASEAVVECALDRELKIVLPMEVSHYDDEHMGLRFRDSADPEMLRRYQAWLADRVWSQHQRDRAAFRPEGLASSGPGAPPPARPGSQARLLNAREPLVLVIGEGEALAQHIAESLGKKFGVAALDYVQGAVRPTLAALGPGEWGGVRLLLVHQRLRIGSGLELTRELVGTENCPLPILVAGREEDVALKRNRAIAAGAVDFISVEPYNILRLMRTLEDTLRMFA